MVEDTSRLNRSLDIGKYIKSLFFTTHYILQQKQIGNMFQTEVVNI